MTIKLIVGSVDGKFKKMKTFTKWFIINAAILTLSFFAHTQGVFGLIVRNDISYISVASMVLFLGVSGFVGKLSLLADKTPDAVNTPERLMNQLDIGWFVSGHFLNLGLLGTIIGFCHMIGANLNPAAEINATVNSLKIGAGTSLYTTLVGLICSMLLQLQLYIVQYTLKK